MLTTLPARRLPAAALCGLLLACCAAPSDPGWRRPMPPRRWPVTSGAWRRRPNSA